MEHPYGYIKDNKVFLKGFLDLEDREIGEVKEDEASTIAYFENRFTMLLDKVEKLKSDIATNQNKGSFLMKLVHLKDSLKSAGALGDFVSLIDDLENQEKYLHEIIAANRAKNLDLKKALILEAESKMHDTDWRETTEFYKDLKLRWIKTGPVEEEHEKEIEETFENAVQTFFESRRHYYEGLSLQADENIKVYESLVQQARDAFAMADVKEAFEISKRIQKEWKASGKVPAERRQPLWDEFSKLNNRIFSKYKRSLNPGPSMHPREVMKKVEEYSQTMKTLAGLPNSREVIENAKQIQQEWKKLPHRKPREAKMASKSYQFFTDIIFEKAFLEKLIKSKYEDYSERGEEEKNRLKTALLKDLLRRDQNELDNAQNNSENFRVQTKDFEIAMMKKLAGLKRKVDVKNYILRQLSYK